MLDVALPSRANGCDIVYERRAGAPALALEDYTAAPRYRFTENKIRSAAI
jgi:hypothetical protein